MLMEPTMDKLRQMQLRGMATALVAQSQDPDAQALSFEGSYEGRRYSAIVDAGAGRVLAVRRPARREVLGEPRVALGALALLFGEAVIAPGLAVKITVVLATAAPGPSPCVMAIA